MLGIMPSKQIKGCNSLVGAENIKHFQTSCQQVMSLEDMLNTQFRTDAHFSSYNLTGMPMWPRLNKSILPEIRQAGSDVVLAYLTFDWDNANHAEWTTESLAEFAKLIGNCQDPIINSWSVMYTTAHGMRLIYTMSRTVPVEDGEQHLAWMFHHFKEHGFLLIDDGCKDWTRLMRCPQVMRDDKPTWEQSYYDMISRPNVLNMDLVGKRSTKTIARKTFFIKEKQELPLIDKLEGLLSAKAKGSERYTQTDFFKRAKRTLKDSQYLDILFNNAAPCWEAGHRNDEIVKMIGFITPILLKKARATVQQVFALAIGPLLTLGSDQDWVSHGWNALLDIYEREVNKYNAEKEERAEKVSKEISTLDKMVEGMQEWCESPALFKDEASAREEVKANCIATVQSWAYLMQDDGRFLDFAINKDQLISRIRRTSLKDILETSKINYTGEEVDISAATLLNTYSTPVCEIQMRPVGNAGGYIENINGEKPVLVLSTFCRNDNLEPTYNPFVNEWLKNLFGEYFKKGCAWIGNALAFEEGLICALSMEGASSAGKKLLTEGLSECLKVPYVAGPEAMYHQSSAFLKTPFLVVNEAWPNIRGATSPADKFKSLTGGDGIVVNEKFKPSVRVLCPVRLIMTANDDGIIKELIKGKDMVLDNRIAVGERLFHFKVPSKAATYLNSIGGRGFTARKGQRWIRPDSGPDSSDFIVAKHFLWLWKNRDTVDPKQRYLVMGNCAPGAGAGKQNVLEKLLADNNHTPIVAKAIIDMMDNTGVWRSAQFIRINQDMTRLWVTRNGVHRYVKEVMEERVSESELYSGMLNILETPEPMKFDDVHWYEISVDTLAMIATEKGIAKTYVRNMYMKRIEGGLAVA